MTALAELPPMWDDDTPDTAPGGQKADAAPYACEVCGKPLVYAGKGRKPKFCEDHKPASQARSTGARRTRGGMSHDTIKESVTGMVGAISLALTAVAIPTRNPAFIADGVAVRDNAPNIGEAVASWGDNNKAVRDAVEKFIAAAGIGGVIVALAPVAIAIAGNHRAPITSDIPVGGD